MSHISIYHTQDTFLFKSLWINIRKRPYLIHFTFQKIGTLINNHYCLWAIIIAAHLFIYFCDSLIEHKPKSKYIVLTHEAIGCLSRHIKDHLFTCQTANCFSSINRTLFTYLNWRFHPKTPKSCVLQLFLYYIVTIKMTQHTLGTCMQNLRGSGNI